MAEIVEFPTKDKPADASTPDIGRVAQPNTFSIIMAGQAAWTRLNQHETWRDWSSVGKALAIGRAEALAIARTSEPVGRRYNMAFSDWLGWHRFAGISKSTRARLLECIENLSAIEAWLDTLKPEKRLRMNHPTTVLSTWKKATTEPAEPTEPPPISISELAQAFERLAPSDRAALVDKILQNHPELVPQKLLQQFLRQHQRPERTVNAKIVSLADAVTAYMHHPEQHVDEIRKAAAQIRHLAEPVGEPTKPATITQSDLDRSAWPRAMGFKTAAAVEARR